MREHIIDPSITVLMNHINAHPNKMVRALKSFMAQDYENAQLLILNTHPTPLEIIGGSRIQVINYPDIFTRPVEQAAYIIKLVTSDCWTVLDDDDQLDPDHLSQLVKYWNGCIERTNKPLSVCGMKHIAHYQDKIVPIDFPGWHMTLFQTLLPKEVDRIYQLFPFNYYCGEDTWITTNTFWDKRRFNGRGTYHWDRVGDMHLSSHETGGNKTSRGIYESAMRYWRIKQKSLATPLKPIQI